MMHDKCPELDSCFSQCLDHKFVGRVWPKSLNTPKSGTVLNVNMCRPTKPKSELDMGWMHL